MLWGLVKKVCIAPSLSTIVSSIFQMNPDQLSGTQVIAGSILYSFELYADFSGYMDIVIGISYLFGIEIKENFSRPYMSCSIEEFWHKWHISLGAWFREYVFYPISTSKITIGIRRSSKKIKYPRIKKNIPAVLPIMITWFCTGIWHGGSLNWLIWGGINGLIIILERFLNITNVENRPVSDFRKMIRLFSMIRTFLIVCMLRIVSHTDSIQHASALFKRVFFGMFSFSEYRISNETNFYIAHVGIFSIIVSDLYYCSTRTEKLFNNTNPFFRFALACFGIHLYLMNQGSVSADFMYMKF